MAPNLLPFWVGWRSERGGPKSVFGGNGRMSDVSASNRIALSRPVAAYRREPRKLTAPLPRLFITPRSRVVLRNFEQNNPEGRFPVYPGAQTNPKGNFA